MNLSIRSLRRRSPPALCAAILLLLTAGCGDGRQAADAPPADAGVNADAGAAVQDAGADAGAGGDGGQAADAGRAEWSMGLPSTGNLGTRRQYSIARSIIHLHNVFSHDACDGKPRLEDGSPNEECHLKFRDAICADHIDFAMMTDHYGFVVDTDNFDDLYMQRAGDRWEDEGQAHSASVVPCNDGHEVRIMIGLEGEASPIGIVRHPVEGDAAARQAAYEDTSAAGIQRLRDAGATIAAIHIEDRSEDWLDATDLDLIEACNLHILLAPNIRGDVGLDPGAAAAAFSGWVFDQINYPKTSDLVFLEFHERVPFFMDRWDRLLGRRMIGAFAGNDAHQNVMQTAMADGERPDSYRRMMKWYVNHLLVDGRTGAAAREALRADRLYQVFEVLGTPADFDFFATQGDATCEMGGAVPAGGPVTLRAPVPSPMGAAPGEDAIRMVLYKITAAGAEAVYDGAGPVEYTDAAPARYRLEVFITPQHLAPFLRREATRLVREYPWIYANAIEVR